MLSSSMRISVGGVPAGTAAESSIAVSMAWSMTTATVWAVSKCRAAGRRTFIAARTGRPKIS